MSDAAVATKSAEGLQRLLEDLVRDGWLMGMNAGLDPALTRMDPTTGVFNRIHFEKLVAVAIEDAQRHRDPRIGDGPAHGQVAVLSVRILDWSAVGATMGAEGLEPIGNRVARGLEEALRADDQLARTRDDVFSLLLRGCPMETLELIAHRCTAIVSDRTVDLGGHIGKLSVASRVVAWDGHKTARELIEATFPPLH